MGKLPFISSKIDLDWSLWRYCSHYIAVTICMVMMIVIVML